MASRRELSCSSIICSSTDSSISINARRKFRLTMETINPYVKGMEYAVRGKLPLEAIDIERAIKKVCFCMLVGGASYMVHGVCSLRKTLCLCYHHHSSCIRRDVIYDFITLSCQLISSTFSCSIN